VDNTVIIYQESQAIQHDLLLAEYGTSLTVAKFNSWDNMKSKFVACGIKQIDKKHNNAITNEFNNLYKKLTSILDRE